MTFRARLLVAFAIAAAVAAVSLPARAEIGGDAHSWLTSVPREGAIDFAIKRNGETIGSHRLKFVRQGNEVAVDIDIRIAVKIAFITVYDYSHRNQETWRDGKLVSIETATDDDGERHSVRAVRDGGVLQVDGDLFKGEAPPDILPTSYWNPATISATQLLNSQDGSLSQVKVQSLGTDKVKVGGSEVEATHYRLSGDLKVDLWYDKEGMWVKTAFSAPGDGSLISYELMQKVTPSRPGAPAATATREVAAPAMP